MANIAIQPKGNYVDATFGRGGHTRALLERLDSDGKIWAFDRDPVAIQYGRETLADPRIQFLHAPFSELAREAEAHGFKDQIDGIIVDLGVSSPQIDDPDRGFSFMHSGPLDMRMDPTRGRTAGEWLNSASEQQIADVLWNYGEERLSRKIARAIVQARKTQAICTTSQLVAIIAQIVNLRASNHKHPATRTFMALRIFINDELAQIQTLLPQCLEVLRTGGRLAVISFHSLEDRIVKRFIRDSQPRFSRIGRALKPTEAEIRDNPRARSAILRIAEKVS